MSKLIFLENFRRLSLQNVRLSRISTRNFCDEKSKPEDDKTHPKINEKAQNASNKLNSLLKTMLDDSYKKPNIDLTLAQPTKKISKQKKKQIENLDQNSKDLNENILKATKQVAEHIGGNVNQTENELLMKLLLRKGENANTGNVPNSLSDLIVGMKIDRTKKAPPQTPVITRAQYVRKNLGDNAPTDRRPKRHFRDINAKVGGRVELFGGVGLGIFKDVANAKEENLLTTSDALHQRELKLTIMHPPENYFQKMILWTEQGKLWKFPIDNEQGLEEYNVYFVEHVFLETHLEGWCPKKGPVRHFMELVCVGLSKNPYLSVQEKKNHIEWFQDYFKGKVDLLKEVGALGLPTNVPKLEMENTKTTP